MNSPAEILACADADGWEIAEREDSPVYWAVTRSTQATHRTRMVDLVTLKSSEDVMVGAVQREVPISNTESRVQEWTFSDEHAAKFAVLYLVKQNTASFGAILD